MWAPLLDFFFLYFSSFFWQIVCTWAVLAAEDGIGLLQCDSGIDRSGWDTKRSLRSSWEQASRIYWWRFTPSSKVCSCWRWDKAARGMGRRDEWFRGTARGGEQWGGECEGKASSAREEKILVEGELVPSGGPAHGEGWDGMGKSHTGGFGVLQQRCPLGYSCLCGMLGVAKVGIFWGAAAPSGVCVSPGSS